MNPTASSLQQHPAPALTSVEGRAETSLSLPRIDERPPIDVRRCVEPGTGFALVLAALAGLFVAALLVATTIGALVAPVMWLVSFTMARKATLQMRASAVRVGPRQFPWIHACAESFARRLGLKEAPEIHVFDAAEVNGFALRFGRKNGILLTDESVAACLEERPDALAFLIAHEMGHIALGHHRWWRSPFRRLHKVSRLDELSADNVACDLLGSQRAAEEGVLLLAVGPRLLAHVDHEAAREQAAEAAAHGPTRRSEAALTHPLTMRRLDHAVRRCAAAA